MSLWRVVGPVKDRQRVGDYRVCAGVVVVLGPAVVTTGATAVVVIILVVV